MCTALFVGFLIFKFFLVKYDPIHITTYEKRLNSNFHNASRWMDKYDRMTNSNWMEMFVECMLYRNIANNLMKARARDEKYLPANSYLNVDFAEVKVIAKFL